MRIDSRQAQGPKRTGVARGLGIVAVSIVAAIITLLAEGLDTKSLFAHWRRLGSTVHTQSLPIAVPSLGIQPGPKVIARLGTEASSSKRPIQLFLVRTIPGKDPHSGQAMIGADADNPQTYRQGGILESGAVIEEIYADHVVLVRGDTRYSLYLKTYGQSAENSEETSLARSGEGLDPPSETWMSDERVTNYVRPVPEYSDNAVIGFRVYPGVESMVFDQLGLRAGDLITTINGQAIRTGDEAMELLDRVIKGQSLLVAVRRNGNELEIDLDGSIVEHTERSRRTAGTSLLVPIP